MILVIIMVLNRIMVAILKTASVCCLVLCFIQVVLAD